jgi:hypothetical protein
MGKRKHAQRKHKNKSKIQKKEQNNIYIDNIELIKNKKKNV